VGFGGAELAERVGFEGSEESSQQADAKDKSTAKKPTASLEASQNSAQLCAELAEVVATWPRLTREIRGAVLALLHCIAPRQNR